LELSRRIVTYRIDYIIITPSLFFKDAMIFNENIDKMISKYPEALHLVREGSDPFFLT